MTKTAAHENLRVADSMPFLLRRVFSDDNDNSVRNLMKLSILSWHRSSMGWKPTPSGKSPAHITRKNRTNIIRRFLLVIVAAACVDSTANAQYTLTTIATFNRSNGQSSTWTHSILDVLGKTPHWKCEKQSCERAGASLARLRAEDFLETT
jgi:hypothetical protein